MKLTVLTDNNTYIDRYYLGEPAVSYYIEDEGISLLLDTGYSDVYVKNAAAMGIDLRQVDKLVLSHAHDDHTGGLVHFPVQDGSVPLIAHETVFQPRRCDGLSIGAPYSREEAAGRFDLQLFREPVQVSPHIIWLGPGSGSCTPVTAQPSPPGRPSMPGLPYGRSVWAWN